MDGRAAVRLTWQYRRVMWTRRIATILSSPRGPTIRYRRTIVLVALGLALASVAQGQQPGERFRIDPRDLPAPFSTPSVANPPIAVSRPNGAGLNLPPGFSATIFADRLGHARWIETAPNGDVFLAQPDNGVVTLLRDSDGDGRADINVPFAQGLRQPHGLAVRPGYLYVADVDRVWRIPYRPGDTRPAGPREAVTPAGALGDGGGHWTRNLAFSPDGSRFYVAIGSRGNLGEESEPRATVQEFRSDGSNRRTFAAGLRNPVGIAFRPGSSDLYVVVNERDGLGDGLVPDYLTRVEDGGFYGWPYAYIGPNPQPRLAERRPDLVARSLVPDVLFQSHSAPLGLAFYTGTQFPDDYRGDAFVAFHGSWNASQPTGYMIVRVPFANGRPAGHYQAFATGFAMPGPGRARVWGRPVGLAIAADGSLLAADDVGNVVWRIQYRR